MGNIDFVFAVRDSTSSPAGARKTGLTPTWVHFKRLSDKASVTPTPTISEIGNGQYMLSYDVEAGAFAGEIAGQIDVGATLTAPGDRYIDVVLTRDSSRVVYSLPEEAAGDDGGLPIVDGSGQVAARVTDYATDQSPNALLLVTPANKLATDGNGKVTPAGNIDGYTVEEAIRVILAAVAGRVTGAATNTPLVKNPLGTKTRIAPVVDADGNRSSVTIDAT